MTMTGLIPAARMQRLGTETAFEVLARAEALQPHLNAFVTLTAERALAEARAAESELSAGLSRGPLHGIPYVAKDLYDVAGHPTQAGCPQLADNIASNDAAVVDRLARAGMVLIGKTHTVQFAFGGVGLSPSFSMRMSSSARTGLL